MASADPVRKEAARADQEAGGNRVAITVCIILATLMQVLDTTIANVSLPYIQGSVSASQDQIEWVLTSYLVAAAIMTPLTGFLAARFGMKRLFIFSVVGFILASMACGASTSLDEIVIFRFLQGIAGAALVPLSQSVLLTIYPRERQGFAMALWGVAVMAGPILGPVIGGWLTEYYSWRYVFYINLPIGILAFLGMTVFLRETPRNVAARLDWFGFGTLSLAIGALQILLDRGEELDWFGSSEILLEAVICASAFYLFLVHIFTSDAPFVRPGLFKDRNFSAGVLIGFSIGLSYFASLALQPPYLEELMGYPILTAGLVMAPRGFGTMGAMMIVGRLIGKVDTRLLLLLGLGLSAWSFYEMTGWTPAISEWTIISVGIVQGIGLGFLFVPLSVATLSTLPAEHRTEGTSMYTLTRNIGSSIGISVVNSLLTTNIQVNHADIAREVTPLNPALANPEIARLLDPFSAAGRAAINAIVAQQAQIIAYIDDYKFLMLATIAVIPLIIFFRKVSGGTPPNTAAMH